MGASPEELGHRPSHLRTELRGAVRARDEEALVTLFPTKSCPLPKPGRIAVTVVNHYGDEILKAVET
ncbi:hypothetical protein [Streptomyces thermoalcalitolerans]|uniref:Uncharacterized protein n=1 Tax=Streptomyces thermoalcalitolerans TaxID=65605 RepID=A0ABN1NVV5_9ACTN